MSEPSKWALERAKALDYYGLIECSPAGHKVDWNRIALALDAARREAIEEAIERVEAIYEGKDGSRDPGVVERTCIKIKHAIRALADREPQ